MKDRVEGQSRRTESKDRPKDGVQTETFNGNEHVSIKEENEERDVLHWGELGVGGKIGDIPLAAVFNLNRVPLSAVHLHNR